MAAYDFTTQRLFVEAELAEGGRIELDRAGSNYLLNVLRLQPGAAILVFNGQAGEWRARLESSIGRIAALRVETRTRPQTPRPDLVLLFAPLKHARLDYMVQKAVEMGVGSLRPVLTRRTVPSRVNLERMRANVVEATEQCGVLAIPEVEPPLRLAEALAALASDRLLIFCDEDAPVANPIQALSEAGCARVAVLIGPEGGFDPAEREAILARAPVRRISLGPRILRADTAAVAALAAVQMTLGDWR